MKQNDVLDYLDSKLVNRAILDQYEKLNIRKKLFIILMIIATIFIGLVAVTLGPLEMTIKDSYLVIIHHIFPSLVGSIDKVIDGTVWQVRVPRLLSGLVVGFGLAISGAVMQPVLRNPMASPYTLGISSAAGFGAALAIALGKSFGIGSFTVIGNAFFFSVLVVLIITFISRWKNATPEVMILAGIALSFLFNAGITLLQYFVDPIYTKQMVFWSAGSLYKGTWDNLHYIFPVVLIFSIFLIYKSKDINSISVGDEVAKSTGINVERTRLTLMIVSSLLTAVLIAFMGTIGFIGLVAPHIARMILGGDNRFVVIASGFVGGFLLVVSDIVAMNLLLPIVLPIGVITAFMGAPLFLYLILKMKRGNF